MTKRLLVLTAFVGLTSIGSTQAASASIITPGPSDMTEMTDFRAEWCAMNSENGGAKDDVAQVCFGRAKFRDSLSVRSFAFVTEAGTKFLYVEKGLPGVELLNLEFEILGPVQGVFKGVVASMQRKPEIGNVELSIDSRGEVDGVLGWTPQFGLLRAQRDQR